MTPAEIKSILARFGGRANKKLGQHFLIDRSVLAKIMETADIHPDDRILEVGPGLGVLTAALLDFGAEVIAIEQDQRLIDYLVGAYCNTPLRIIHGDAARIDWMTFVDRRPWKFVSNLPYGITSLALRKALWSSHPPIKVVVLVQREVAERSIAKDGKTSLLSLMVALASSSAGIVKRVPAGAFFPPPKVESAILEIVPLKIEDRMQKWGMDPEKIMELAKRGFAHPRKLLASNLQLKADDRLLFKTIGINERARSEDLSPEDWARLAKALSIR